MSFYNANHRPSTDSLADDVRNGLALRSDLNKPTLSRRYMKRNLSPTFSMISRAEQPIPQPRATSDTASILWISICPVCMGRVSAGGRVFSKWSQEPRRIYIVSDSWVSDKSVDWLDILVQRNTKRKRTGANGTTSSAGGGAELNKSDDVWRARDTLMRRATDTPSFDTNFQPSNCDP